MKKGSDEEIACVENEIIEMPDEIGRMGRDLTGFMDVSMSKLLVQEILAAAGHLASIGIIYICLYAILLLCRN